jgi:predicted ATPase
MEAYRQQVREGKLHEDVAQMNALAQLDALHWKLVDYDPAAITPKPASQPAPASPGGGSWLSSLFSSGDDTKAAAEAPSSSAPDGVPPGVYVYGGVGCGKTFIMDLFFDETDFTPKRRVHFHAFMLEVHQRLHLLRKEGLKEDPIPHVVTQLLKEGTLICFDEFQVTDVGDAVLLRRLFSALLDRGAVVVATSNRPPKDLYYNGIQRCVGTTFGG